MAAQDIDALIQALHALVRTQKASTEELVQFVAPIVALPDLLERQLTVLEQRFADQMIGTVQMEMVKIQADNDVHGRVVEAYRSTIDEALEAYRADLAKVTARYTLLQEELSRDALARIRALDAPALDLLAEDLEAGVAAFYRQVYVPRSEVLEATIGDSGGAREHSLGTLLEDVSELCDVVLSGHSGTASVLSDHIVKTDRRSSDVVGVPAFFVSLDEGGTSRDEFFLDPAIAGDGISTLALEAGRAPAELSDLYGALAAKRDGPSIVEQMLDPRNARQLESRERSAVVTALRAQLTAAGMQAVEQERLLKELPNLEHCELPGAA